MQEENKPTFYYPEVEAFYQYGMDIPEDKVKAILELPRETLVKDMEAVLQDAVDRYAYFSENKNLPFEQICSVYHAIWVLGDLKATEALPSVFNLLRQNNDQLEFWFSDYITENLWEDLFSIAGHDLEMLTPLFFDPENLWFVKILPTTVACQVFLHFRERRDEVIRWFKNLLEQLLRLDKNDSTIDDNAIGSLVANLYYVNAKRLLPEIKELYERDWVAMDICGDYASIEGDMQKGIPRHVRRDMRSDIFAKYKGALSSWGYYRKARKPKVKKQPDLSYANLPLGIIKRAAAKVGRNDLCSCGSGKKYKKCCLNK